MGIWLRYKRKKDSEYYRISDVMIFRGRFNLHQWKDRLVESGILI